MSPNFIFNCPVCHARINATPAHVGVKMPCPKCGQRLQVPAPPKKPVPPPNRTVLGQVDDPGAPTRPIGASPSFSPAGAGPHRTGHRPPSRMHRARALLQQSAKRPWVLAASGAGGLCLLALIGFLVWFLTAHHEAKADQPVAVVPPAPKPDPKPDSPHTDPDPNKGKPQPPAAMKPEEVIASAKPSVAFVKNRGGSGSGFLVDGGFIVTNSHVVAEDTIGGAYVTFPSSDFKNDKFKVRLAYEDRTRDLAILQMLAPPALPPLRLNTAALAEGQDVLAIGSPGVFVTEGGVSENSADKGTLSNPNFFSSKFNEAKKDLRYIQHSAKINHGNSGGPLLDMRAEVIGVNVIGLDALGLDGVKLAIPADELQAIIGKAKDRNGAAIDHATAIHDAHIMAINLEKAAAAYHDSALLCANKAQELAKPGTSPGDIYVAVRQAIAKAQQKSIDEAKQQGKDPEFIDPALTRVVFLEPELPEMTDLLNGDTLDKDLQAKFRLMRELYLDARKLYEMPASAVDLDDVQRKLNAMTSDFRNLKQSLEGWFGSVF